MTPRLNVRTVCGLILIALCVAAAVGICVAADAIGGAR